MTRINRWLVVACLLFGQAHNLVPHHHHSDVSPMAGHSGKITLEHLAFDCAHPEFAGHDDLPSDTASRRYQQTSTHAMLAGRVGSVTITAERLVAIVAVGLVDCAPIHGPPSPNTSPRAPPADFA